MRSGCSNRGSTSRSISSRDLPPALRSWFLDQDIAEFDRLAGLDGEVLADLNPLVGIVAGRKVDDAVQSPRDQGGQGDAALGVGDRASWARAEVLGIDVRH